MQRFRLVSSPVQTLDTIFSIWVSADAPLADWERVFDFGNGQEDNNILLTHSTDNTLLFSVRRGTGDTHLWGINCWAHFMGDHAVVFNLYPLAPGKTLVRTKWLVNENAVEGVDYDVEHLISVWMETNRQDATLVELAHQGVQSAGYRPGPYSRFTEKTLNDWTTWYVERMRANGYW